MRMTKEVAIEEGRDKGKRFLITEMDAFRAEDWGIRALQAICSGGASLASNNIKGRINGELSSDEKDLIDQGMIGLARFGLETLGRIPYEMSKPLLDELLDCVQIYGTAGDVNTLRSIITEDISSPKTLFFLRQEALFLHLDQLKKDVG